MLCGTVETSVDAVTIGCTPVLDAPSPSYEELALQHEGELLPGVTPGTESLALAASAAMRATSSLVRGTHVCSGGTESMR
ncbi:hypothetical protein [Streptosporangium vulgare]|uniref:hypothetical protein n=1 Tax=Streptosporangium vulgare TaxID=46190 RepID=UPI0031D8A3C7